MFGLGASIDAVSARTRSYEQFGMAREQSDQAWKRQKKLAMNRYQWMVGDLRKAGLNPMLAIGGASPPSASVAMGATPNMQGTSFAQGFQASAAAKEAAGRVKLQRTQGEVMEAQRDLNKQQMEHVQAQMANLGQDNIRKQIENMLVAYQVPEAKASAELWKKIGEQGKAGQFALPFAAKALLGGTNIWKESRR